MLLAPTCVAGILTMHGGAMAEDLGFAGYTWETDRAEPNVWEVLPSYMGKTDVLHLQTFSQTTNPSSDAFYQYEGRAAATGLGSGAGVIAGSVYIPSTFSTSSGGEYINLGLWGVVGTTGSPTSYPVISFYNGPNEDPGGKETIQDGNLANVGEVRVFDGYKWIVVTGPNAASLPGIDNNPTINLGGWNDIRIEYVPGENADESMSIIRLNGTAIATLSCANNSLACGDFEAGDVEHDTLYSMIINTRTNGTAPQDTYWADVYAATLLTDSEPVHFAPGQTFTGNLDIQPGAGTSGGTIVEPATVEGTVRVLDGGTLGGIVKVIYDVDSNGTLSPGNSPGFIDIGGDYNAGPSATFDLEVDLSASTPTAAVDYDQVRIGGNATGSTSIFLFDPSVGSPTTPLSTTGPVGDIGAIQLVTIGGTGGLANFTLGQRYVRNGMDVNLVQLAGALGLSLTVADESYALASIPALSLAAGDALYGSYVDRRGLDWDMGRSAWARGIAMSQTIDNGLGTSKGELYGGQFGLDLFALGDPSTRFGLTFGYASQSADVYSPTGMMSGAVSGTAPSFGAYVTHQENQLYADLSGQYRWLNYDLSTPMTPSMSVDGGQMVLSAEVGAKLQNGGAMLVPSVQMTYLHDFLDPSTTGPFAATYSQNDALLARARLLAQVTTGATTFYGSVGIVGDLLGKKTTTVSGTPLQSDLGGAGAELAVGVDGKLAPNLNIFGSFQYGIAFDGNSDTKIGRAGLRLRF
jgi:outer membrane autotransporter protein